MNKFILTATLLLSASTATASEVYTILHPDGTTSQVILPEPLYKPQKYYGELHKCRDTAGNRLPEEECLYQKKYDSPVPVNQK